jgi:preprotein translocase subunit Sss1
MDPLTVLALAQTAFAGLKAGIAAGKEIQHVAKDLSDLWGSLAKLTQIAAEPPRKSLFSSKSPEQIAIERYTAKAEAQDLTAKAKNMFVGQFGLAAWDQVQREVINIRKEIEREKYMAEKARAAKLEEICDAAVITMIVLGLVGMIGLIGMVLLVRG